MKTSQPHRYIVPIVMSPFMYSKQNLWTIDHHRIVTGATSATATATAAAAATAPAQ